MASDDIPHTNVSELSSRTSDAIFYYPPSNPTKRSGTNPNGFKLAIDGHTYISERVKRVLDNNDLFLQETSPQNANNSGTVEVQETTELAQALQELNQDRIQTGTRMSGIDMRSNLHPMEVSGILCIDTLVSMRFLPIGVLQFTRQKKRLAVSMRGKGRDDIVAVVAGKRQVEANNGSSVIDRMRNFFKGNDGVS